MFVDWHLGTIAKSEILKNNKKKTNTRKQPTVEVPCSTPGKTIEKVILKLDSSGKVGSKMSQGRGFRLREQCGQRCGDWKE